MAETQDVALFLIPEDQDIVAVDGDERVVSALIIMDELGFSQLPVKVAGVVVGVFSHRSFAQRLLRLGDRQRRGVLELPVEDFVERAAFVHLTDPLDDVYERIQAAEAVLFGGPDAVQGIATAIDFAAHLYRVASPFVLIQQIELGARELVRSRVDDDAIETMAHRALDRQYGNDHLDRVPTRLVDMTFDELYRLIIHSENFKIVGPAFGSVELTRSRLEATREIRNAIFHFRRSATVEDHGVLVDAQQWIARRLMRVPPAGESK